MNEIYIVALRQSLEEWGVEVVQGIPTHARHLLLMLRWLEATHIDREDTDAVGVALFGMLAEQLLSYADTENWLLQVGDESVEIVLSQIVHRVACLALSREDDTVGRCYLFRVIGPEGLDAETLHRVYHGENVAGVVFYDRNLHSFSLIKLQVFFRKTIFRAKLVKKNHKMAKKKKLYIISLSFLIKCYFHALNHAENANFAS